MESIIHYVQKINELVNTNLGGSHSAKIILYTVNFAEIVDCQNKDDWQKSSEILNHAAISLQKAGADFIIMATNTMHKVVDSMLINVDIPFLHIAHATLEQVKKAKKDVSCVPVFDSTEIHAEAAVEFALS